MERSNTPQKKRHHYVPETYLRAFCNEQGKLFVYRKDEPDKALPLVPDATQIRRYYYSQPTPDGGQDNNTLEDLFGSLEGKWPAAVAALHRREDANAHLDTIFQFMSLQRVRVPAARDVAEAVDAQAVKATMAMLLEQGKLPEFLGGKDLLDSVEVAIDPHRSIHAMVDMMQGMAPLYNAIGLAAVHNNTGTPFLTSDNPVLWFDPSLPFKSQLPYTVDPENGAVLLVFPVSPMLAIVGSTEYRTVYGGQGLLHTDVPDENWVEMINAQVCRFAYEAVISSTPGQEELVAAFADLSPVLETTTTTTKGGVVSHMRQVFGKRSTKPKWKPSEG